jgi:hypothetical protein
LAGTGEAPKGAYHVESDDILEGKVADLIKLHKKAADNLWTTTRGQPKDEERL